MTTDLEFYAKISAIENRLSVLEALLLRIYELLLQSRSAPPRIFHGGSS
jgi:hypothetical protein